jgi:hypothetical protein
MSKYGYRCEGRGVKSDVMDVTVGASMAALMCYAQ